MAKLFKILIFIANMALILFMGTNYALSPLDPNNKKQINISIPPNTSVTKMAIMLEEANIIKSKYFFKYYVRYEKLDAKLKAGNYKLSPSMSLAEITKALQKGEQERIMFTIPEGYTVKQIALLLDSKQLADYDNFLNTTQKNKFNYAFLDYEDQVNNPLEGYLFPDTYYIPKGFTEEELINMMLKRFDEVFDETMRAQAEKLGMNIKEAVTMASLVEKEARVAKERPVIAGVFYNRIDKKMRLESCATIQYLLGKTKPVLLYEDLKIESPYNTYRNSGLPPGPIANPGKASLTAALYPEKTSYYYFVAKKDGSHHFSKTLAEHNSAKRKYLE